MSDKDVNHSIRYYFVRFSRLWRDNVSPHFADMFNSLADTINSFMRFILFMFASIFTLLSEICTKIGNKCYRKQKQQPTVVQLKVIEDNNIRLI